jgi:phage-related protein
MPKTAIRVFRDFDSKEHLRDWMRALRKTNRKAYAKCLARMIDLARDGYDLRRPIAAHLVDGIYELRARERRVNYRILYFFCGQNIACLSHGFTKEGQVPEIEIERAKTRKSYVEGDPKRFTSEWKVPQ